MMSRRPRRTPAASAAWSTGAVLLAASAATIAARALTDRSTAEIVAAVALAYLAVLTLAQALVYGCSLAWHAGRSYRRTDRPALPQSQRAAYTPEQVAQHRDYAQADVLAYARQAAAWASSEVPGVTRRHAAPSAPACDGLTVPMPVYDAWMVGVPTDGTPALPPLGPTPTVPMPVVVVDAQPWPWSPPVAEPVATGAQRGRT